MPKFRKKTIEIEAVQWFKPGDHPDVIDGSCSVMSSYTMQTALEGEITVTSGDWIITDAKGEVHPCRDDIFKATYDVVEETK